MNYTTNIFDESTALSKGKCKSSKKCNSCGRILPLWMYSCNAKAKDGLRTTCKDCDKESQKRSRSKIKYVEPTRFKQCSDCGRIKPIEQFGIDKTKTDYHRSYCLECLTLRSSRTKKNNKTIVKKNNKVVESFHERLVEDLAKITEEQTEKDIQEQINYLTKKDED